MRHASRLLMLACLLALVLPADAAETCDLQPVMQVDAVRLTAGDGTITIDAYGTSESAGWKSPDLKVAGVADGVATVDFVACRPEMSAQVLTPIQTQQTLALDRTKVKSVLIRARTNDTLVTLSAK